MVNFDELERLVRTNDVTRIEDMIAEGATINGSNTNTRVPNLISVAAKRNHWKVVKVLIDAGCFLESGDKDGVCRICAWALETDCGADYLCTFLESACPDFDGSLGLSGGGGSGHVILDTSNQCPGYDGTYKYSVTGSCITPRTPMD
jgi:hypothetical protein